MAGINYTQKDCWLAPSDSRERAISVNQLLYNLVTNTDLMKKLSPISSGRYNIFGPNSRVHSLDKYVILTNVNARCVVALGFPPVSVPSQQPTVYVLYDGAFSYGFLPKVGYGLLDVPTTEGQWHDGLLQGFHGSEYPIQFKVDKSRVERFSGFVFTGSDERKRAFVLNFEGDWGWGIDGDFLKHSKQGDSFLVDEVLNNELHSEPFRYLTQESIDYHIIQYLHQIDIHNQNK